MKDIIPGCVLFLLAASACGTDGGYSDIEPAPPPESDAGVTAHDHSEHLDEAEHAEHLSLSAVPTITPQSVGPLPAGAAGVSVDQVRATTDLPVNSDVGAFRTVCKFSHMNFDDPIVYPGKAGAAHLHTYFGNKLTAANTTANSLATQGATTCSGGTINRSAYWVPTVINGSGKPVVPEEAMIYYKTGYELPANVIKPFPQGLRMIAGDAKSTTAQSKAYWGCWDNYIGHPGSIPNCGEGQRIHMSVVFPQCWDGVNLDSADHKSHLAYPKSGKCPTTHPVAIPEVTINVKWIQKGDVSKWRLSSDMYDSSVAGGFSAHADWFGAWKPEIVKTFVSKCLNTKKDCHAHLLGDGRMMY
jgi:hypothetical protein